MKYLIFLIFITIIKSSIACTAFGIITESGTVIGKNRDFYYDSQKFEILMPLKQFYQWHDNNYNHNNKLFALVSNNDVKMGVNVNGLTAIEEDPLYAKDSSKNRKYFQPINGYSEGMILYGILQNFKTVDELIPFISKIFSLAAPNFYQIADNKKILTVEVGYGLTNKAEYRPFTYKIISRKNAFFVHTNTYLSQQFQSLNNLQENVDFKIGSDYRQDLMKHDIFKFSQNPSEVYKWFLNTKSDRIINDKTGCQNTSIFRSELHNYRQIYQDIPNDNVYGTVSNLIVVNNENLYDSIVDVKIVNSINTLNNGNQVFKYKELKTSLYNLFFSKRKRFLEKKFIRLPPVKGICY